MSAEAHVNDLFKPVLTALPRRLDVTQLQEAWDKGHIELDGRIMVPKIGGGTVPAVDNFATLAETTTTADPSTAGTSLAVTSRTNFSQSGQFMLLVQDAENDKTNREIMRVTAGTGAGAGSFTVVRGQEGTTGVAHAIGSYVAQVITAQALFRIAHRVPDPSDQSLLAWSGDPFGAFDSATASVVSGTVQVIRVPLTFPMTISNVVYGVTAVGATLTAGQNFVGIYDSAGARQALSADQASSWTSLGQKTTAMTSAWTPATTGASAFCWVAFLSVGTTVPRFAVLNNTANTGAIAVVNFGATRTGRANTAQTSLPATLGAITTSGVSIWVGLS